MSEIILLAAVLWDFVLGEPPVKIHPTVWMGNYISGLWKRRPVGSDKSLFLFGFILLLSGLCLFASLPFFLGVVLKGYPYLLAILSIPLLKASFSLRYLLKSGREIKKALGDDNLQEARRLTSYHLVSRNTDKLDRREIASCVIESLSENITDSVTSPVFFYILLGLPGAWAYRFINTADAMIAYRKDDYEWGGKATAWTDSLVNLIPSRITALLIVAASFLLPGASGKSAWNVMIKDRKNTASPNAGWTMAAMAGALSVRLEKKGEYVLGGYFELPDSGKIDMCLRITVLSLLLTLAVLAAALRGGLWVLYTAV